MKLTTNPSEEGATEITKKCAGCGRTKKKSEYRACKLGKISGQCKKCRNAAARAAWQKSGKHHYKLRSVKTREESRKVVDLTSLGVTGNRCICGLFTTRKLKDGLCEDCTRKLEEISI